MQDEQVVAQKVTSSSLLFLVSVAMLWPFKLVMLMSGAGRNEELLKMK